MEFSKKRKPNKKKLTQKVTTYELKGVTMLSEKIKFKLYIFL